MMNTMQQTENPMVYIDGGDCIVVYCLYPDKDDCRSYSIPKSDLENIVTQYIWTKRLLKTGWLSKSDVLEFLSLAEQLAPEIRIEMPDI